MNIVFICSSLEPGRDGAGDQTRALAGELIRQGHRAVAIAMYERNIAEPVEGVQEAEGVFLPTLRLPAALSASYRYERIAAWTNRYKPDWVSVQYVGFGFHRYGMPWEMMFQLRRAIGPVKLHLMLWELWCGMAVCASRKERLLGAVQKVFLKRLLAALKPHNVSTSTFNYAVDLRRIGVEANLIHVFGNIPPNNYGSDQDWDEVAANSTLLPLRDRPDGWLVLGFFGAVYPCPGLEQLLQTAAGAASQMKRRLGVLAIGHGRGQDVGVFVQSIPGAAYWKTGPLAPAMVNRAMQLVDMGVVTTTAAGLTKSSTAIAWLERGVPILISGQDHTYNPSDMQHQGIFQVTEAADVIRSFGAKGQLLPKNPLKEVAAIYSSLVPVNQYA